MKMPPVARMALVCALTLAAAGCGGGGSGGSSGQAPSGAADAPAIKTYATVDQFGSFSRVDLVDGGLASSDAGGDLPPNPAKRVYLNRLLTTEGYDLDNNLLDTDADGIADTGFDSYETGAGMTPPKSSRILGANNLYDLFQTTTGTPRLFIPMAQSGGPPFTGGDVSDDGIGDGGPGHFGNAYAVTATSLIPTLPTLPNFMGTPNATGSGAGPSPIGTIQDQHQFIQIEFPYRIDVDSLFNFTNTTNSFLGDSQPTGDNVVIEKRWVSRALDPTTIPEGAYDINIVDHTGEHRHVSGIAIIGGTAAIPVNQGFEKLATIDVDISNIPEGAKERILRPNVLTYIAHESPQLITQFSDETVLGRIRVDGTLVLPDPEAQGGLGGRVFGTSDPVVPGAVNDFDMTGVTDEDRRIGFVYFKISHLRSNGSLVEDPYFHTFPVYQGNVGDDPFAIAGSFNRGPAIEVSGATQLPAIDVLDPATDYLVDPPGDPLSDSTNIASTRARFRVDFDKEVIPNSVGFSRRFTIHSVEGRGVVFPFNGNTRPIDSPAQQFVSGAVGAPLAPSIYLAVNQPASIGVNSMSSKYAANFGAASLFDDPTFDDGVTPFPDDSFTSGLFPPQFNQSAMLPRAVVPCDIYPVNQNNLQAYVVEPLVELPPNSVVTLGVCMPGLGMSNNMIPPQRLDTAIEGIFPGLLPALPLLGAQSNFGNYTISGTRFAPFQGLSSVGLGTTPQVAGAVANATIIKVNAGPMDLEGNLFFGPTGPLVPFDTLIDGDFTDATIIPNEVLTNDLSHGGWNVSRTFRIGADAKRPYVNAPVVPQALAVGFGPEGLGVVDLAGTGFTTNAPGGAAEDYLLVTRFLGGNGVLNWDPTGSIAAQTHVRAFGIMGAYTRGTFVDATPATSYESEVAVGSAIATGPSNPAGTTGTPLPGVNEGSSGFETMVRNSFGSQILSNGSEIASVSDVIVGDFLDTIYFDANNPFAVTGLHRTYLNPGQTAVSNNTSSDPPLPNPPPLRFPVGLPFTAVIYDQDDLSRDPFLITGNEALTGDVVMRFNDGTTTSAVTATNGLIQLNPTQNTSNIQNFDEPHIPRAGYGNPFGDNVGNIKYVQTGPLPKTSTTGRVVLGGAGSDDKGSVRAPSYQSRQQIGNFLFVADRVNKKLHAVNSNTMKVIESLSLPDPTGLGLTSDLELLFVSNEGRGTVSIIDANPRNATFMTELKRTPVGQGPRAIAIGGDNEDAHVLNRLDNSISVIDVGTGTVRKTLQSSGLNRPNDACYGMREVSDFPGFQSGTYHGFISNGSDDVLIYESGPSGVAGIGFDNIIGSVKPNEPQVIGDPAFVGMRNPQGIVFDPAHPFDPFAGTIGAFVAHQDPLNGRAVVSRIGYTADSKPGQDIFNAFTANPGFGDKVFKVTRQYLSSFSGIAYDCAINDFNRKRVETSNYGTFADLFNAGASLTTSGTINLPRNSKYPVIDTGGVAGVARTPRWLSDRVYLAIQGGIIDVFDLENSVHLKTIFTEAEPKQLAMYFEQ